MPDTLESLISEKRLLQAAVLLVKSVKTISKPDMLDIGAVSDLRSYLTTQETVSTIMPIYISAACFLTLVMCRVCAIFS